MSFSTEWKERLAWGSAMSLASNLGSYEALGITAHVGCRATLEGRAFAQP